MILGALGALLERSWALLGRSGGALGVPGALVGALGALLGRFGRLLGVFLVDIGVVDLGSTIENTYISRFSIDALSVPPLGQV